MRKSPVVARKQGPGAEKASAGGESPAKIRQRFRQRRRANGRPAGRPYNGPPRLLGKEPVARPAQEMIRASWFFHARPLLAGPARPEIHGGFQLLAEK